MERIANCLRLLGSRSATDTAIEEIWLELCHQSFKDMIEDRLEREAKTAQLQVRPLCNHNLGAALHPCCKLFFSKYRPNEQHMVLNGTSIAIHPLIWNVCKLVVVLSCFM